MDIDKLPEEFQKIFLEGAKALKAKNWDEAISLFSQVLSSYPEFVPALEARAAAYLQKEDLDSAQADLEVALKIEPNNARLYFRLGQVYYRRKDLDQALELFTKAIDLEPMYPAAYMARSQVLRDKGLEEAADLELQKAVDAAREIAKARKVIDFV